MSSFWWLGTVWVWKCDFKKKYPCSTYCLFWSCFSSPALYSLILWRSQANSKLRHILNNQRMIDHELYPQTNIRNEWYFFFQDWVGYGRRRFICRSARRGRIRRPSASVRSKVVNYERRTVGGWWKRFQDGQWDKWIRLKAYMGNIEMSYEGWDSLSYIVATVHGLEPSLYHSSTYQRNRQFNVSSMHAHSTNYWLTTLTWLCRNSIR